MSYCSVSFVNILFSLALVVLDNMHVEEIIENISSGDSTIDIMSSGDEDIDITNDLDPPESSKHYITDVNNSTSEAAQE